FVVVQFANRIAIIKIENNFFIMYLLVFVEFF
ncbi:MAG: hypothetical protein ACI8WA_001413, partial [Polaribacter sp.]